MLPLLSAAQAGRELTAQQEAELSWSGLPFVQDSVLRESSPRQVDMKSGVPKEEKGVWDSQGGGKENHLFFFSTSLVLVTENVFPFKL